MVNQNPYKDLLLIADDNLDSQATQYAAQPSSLLSGVSFDIDQIQPTETSPEPNLLPTSSHEQQQQQQSLFRFRALTTDDRK